MESIADMKQQLAASLQSCSRLGDVAQRCSRSADQAARVAVVALSEARAAAAKAHEAAAKAEAAAVSAENAALSVRAAIEEMADLEVRLVEGLAVIDDDNVDDDAAFK